MAKRGKRMRRIREGDKKDKENKAEERSRREARRIREGEEGKIRTASQSICPVFCPRRREGGTKGWRAAGRQKLT